MESGIEKCAMLVKKSGKRRSADEIELPKLKIAVADQVSLEIHVTK